MNPDRVRWTDSRLDDRFKAIDEELRDLRSVPENMAEQREQMRQLRRDMDQCAEGVKQHRADFSAYIAEQHKTREADRVERKAGQRWMIGTVLASAALVIAAMGLLLGHIS